MRPHVLERRTLLQRVFAEPAARIVLAQGPAGHGKTTFLYQAEAACRAQGIATRWLNLRASGHELTSLLARWQGQLDVPQAILLDDLHHVADREVMNQLQALLERAPAGVRWFLASRTVPALDLAGLQVASELLWLQAADLRWRLQDTEALLNGVGQLVLDARTVAWLHRHTDGWPAPLQLYRQALQSHSSRGPLGANLPLHLPSLNSYLHAAVLGAQPADRRTFLLRCAVLGRWSASSCNAILGRSDAAQTLAQLAQDGLVQRMPADADSYVLPPVLVAFLRRRLRDAQPEQLVSAHLAAAGWHEQQGLLAEAVHHYIEGGDEPQACEVFNTWLEHLITAGNFSQALAVAERLPLQRIEQHPALCLKLCWVYALAGQHERLVRLPLRFGVHSL